MGKRSSCWNSFWRKTRMMRRRSATIWSCCIVVKEGRRSWRSTSDWYSRNSYWKRSSLGCIVIIIVGFICTSRTNGRIVWNYFRRWSKNMKVRIKDLKWCVMWILGSFMNCRIIIRLLTMFIKILLLGSKISINYSLKRGSSSISRSSIILMG